MSLAPERRAALEAALAAEPDWQALVRHFDLSEGFSFIVLLVDSRENAALCREALGAHIGGSASSAIRMIAPQSPDEFRNLPSFLHHMKVEAGTRAIWIEAVVTEGAESIEEWRSAWRACFAGLNPIRNTMQRRIPCALVFAGAPWTQVTIREAAPDLWSIRSTVARVSPRVESVSTMLAERVPAGPVSEPSDAPDPEFALQMADALREKSGQEIQLAELLTRAGRGFYERFQFDRTIEALEEANGLLERYAPDTPALSTNLTWLGRAYCQKAQFDKAEPPLRRALEIDERGLGPDHPIVTTDLNDLASLLKETNRLAEAEPLLRRALEMDERTYGQDHPRVATDLNGLALLLQDTNRLAEAEPMVRRALEINERSYGQDHPRVAVGLNNLAQLLKATNRLTEAEPLMRRVLEIDEKSYGDDHPEIATDLCNLAQLLKDTNRLTEAEPLIRRALEITERSYGRDHPTVAADLNNLAVLLQDTNRLTEAEPLIRRALEIAERSYGQDHPTVATYLNNLSQLLGSTDRLAEAEPLAWRGLQILKRFAENSGFEHPNFRTGLANYREILENLGWSPERIQERLQSLGELDIAEDLAQA